MQVKVPMWLQVLIVIAVSNLWETGVKMAWPHNQDAIGQWIKAWMDKHPDYSQSMEHKACDWFGHEIVSDDDSHNTVDKPNAQDVRPKRSDFKE